MAAELDELIKNRQHNRAEQMRGKIQAAAQWIEEQTTHQGNAPLVLTDIVGG
jgi:hypothetical protein